MSFVCETAKTLWNDFLEKREKELESILLFKSKVKLKLADLEKKMVSF